MKAASPNALFVAESRDARVVGWAHVSVTHLLEAGTRAELNGLIVAEGERSLGAGARLLEAAEEWARKHNCPSHVGAVQRDPRARPQILRTAGLRAL